MAEEQTTESWSPLITGGLVLALGVLATIAFLGSQKPVIVMQPAPQDPTQTPNGAPPDPSQTPSKTSPPSPVDTTNLDAWFRPEDDGMWGVVDIRLDQPNGISFWRGIIDPPEPAYDARGAIVGMSDAEGSLDWLVGLIDFATAEGYERVTIHTPLNISRDFKDWLYQRLSQTASNIENYNQNLPDSPYPRLLWVGIKA